MRPAFTLYSDHSQLFESIYVLKSGGMLLRKHILILLFNHKQYIETTFQCPIKFTGEQNEKS
jgi:hypothetical protein